MSFIGKLFGDNRSPKQCPRCLGKGHVDWNDIRRLGQELKWAPGTCAYCSGTGEVDSKTEDNVPADASYLVINLDEDEREKILNGNPDAIERGHQRDEQMDLFIRQISFLSLEGRLSPSQIAKFFLMARKSLTLTRMKKLN